MQRMPRINVAACPSAVVTGVVRHRDNPIFELTRVSEGCAAMEYLRC